MQKMNEKRMLKVGDWIRVRENNCTACQPSCDSKTGCRSKLLPNDIKRKKKRSAVGGGIVTCVYKIDPKDTNYIYARDVEYVEKGKFLPGDIVCVEKNNVHAYSPITKGKIQPGEFVTIHDVRGLSACYALNDDTNNSLPLKDITLVYRMGKPDIDLTCEPQSKPVTTKEVVMQNLNIKRTVLIEMLKNTIQKHEDAQSKISMNAMATMEKQFKELLTQCIERKGITTNSTVMFNTGVILDDHTVDILKGRLAVLEKADDETLEISMTEFENFFTFEDSQGGCTITLTYTQ